MSGDRMRDWVWLGLLWLAGASGLWAGLSKGYPAAVFAMMSCWILGITWLVAGAER